MYRAKELSAVGSIAQSTLRLLVFLLFFLASLASVIVYRAQKFRSRDAGRENISQYFFCAGREIYDVISMNTTADRDDFNFNLCNEILEDVGVNLMLIF
jgi:hypothetical protein